MFKSKLRFQIRHEDFRQRISQDEEDINSILNWYKLTDAVFLDYLSQVNIRRQYIVSFSHVLRCKEIGKELCFSPNHHNVLLFAGDEADKLQCCVEISHRIQGVCYKPSNSNIDISILGNEMSMSLEPTAGH